MAFDNINKNNNNQKISQDQFYDLLVSRELNWRDIINDLIKTEQLDPWNIDLAILARKYIDRIRELEGLGEGIFFISSKVLLAAALLLRIKSEVLHNNILNIDEILFERETKKDKIVGPSQIIDFAPDEMPEILPRTPLPRGRKVTLQELMKALDKAINTEHRRIKKDLALRRARYDIDFVLPKKKVDIRQKIKELYKKIKGFFFGKKTRKLTYSMLVGTSRDERISCFLPLLHLDSQKKINIEQEKPFEEIEIWLKKKVESEEKIST